MDKKPISKLFEHEGLIISKTSNEEIDDLNHQEVVSLFEHHGIIVFRDFNLASMSCSLLPISTPTRMLQMPYAVQPVLVRREYETLTSKYPTSSCIVKPASLLPGQKLSGYIAMNLPLKMGKRYFVMGSGFGKA